MFPFVMIRDEDRQRGCAKKGRPLGFPKECICCGMSNFSSCFCKAQCSTLKAQSERKANSFKIDGEITRNWRPFKNIITSLFPQQGVQDWRSFLIRTADEIAIKPLSQTLTRFTQCASASVKSSCQNTKINNSGRGRIIKSPVSSTGTV